MLLYWVADKGFKRYNTATWEADGDNLRVDTVLAALEAYTKPQK